MIARRETVRKQAFLERMEYRKTPVRGEGGAPADSFAKCN
jgi:hypothetical protein